MEVAHTLVLLGDRDGMLELTYEARHQGMNRPEIHLAYLQNIPRIGTGKLHAVRG